MYQPSVIVLTPFVCARLSAVNRVSRLSLSKKLAAESTLDKRCDDAYNVTGKAELFAAILNLFPVCLNNNHWVLGLVAVDHTKETVDYYDSMNGNGREATVLIRDFVGFVARKLNTAVNVNMYKVNTHVRSGVPQQQNSHDCCAFLLVFADCLARGVRMAFGQKDMPNYRQLYEIMTNSYVPRS